MEMYLFVHKDLLTDTSQHCFLYKRNFNCLHTRVCRVYYFIFWGREDWGFCLSYVASIVMYCVDAPRRIVTKSLYRTVLPFSILYEKTIGKQCNGYHAVWTMEEPRCNGKTSLQNMTEETHLGNCAGSHSTTAPTTFELVSMFLHN